MSEKRYVVRLDDDPNEPRYYVGSGYAAEGGAIPYFYVGLTRKSTKLYKTKKGAQEAADRFGGRVGMVELPDGSGDPVWLGYVIDTQEDLEKRKRTQEQKSDNVDAFDGKTEKKSDNMDAFDEVVAAGAQTDAADFGWDLGAAAASEGKNAGDGGAQTAAAVAGAQPEGWRERQARIRREIADRRQRRREQRALENEKAGEQTEEPERDWIAGQVGIEDALEEAGMVDAADVMGAEE